MYIEIWYSYVKCVECGAGNTKNPSAKELISLRHKVYHRFLQSSYILAFCKPSYQTCEHWEHTKITKKSHLTQCSLVELNLLPIVCHTLKAIYCGTILYHSIVKRVLLLFITLILLLYDLKSKKAVPRLWQSSVYPVNAEISFLASKVGGGCTFTSVMDAYRGVGGVSCLLDIRSVQNIQEPVTPKSMENPVYSHVESTCMTASFH
jgi:hypothetical protein